MIAKKETKRKNRLSKTTLASIRNIARKGTDAQLEDFIYRIAMNYIAAVRDTDYIDEEDYLKVADTTFECVCPECNAKLTLDLKELTE